MPAPMKLCGSDDEGVHRFLAYDDRSSKCGGALLIAAGLHGRERLVEQPDETVTALGFNGAPRSITEPKKCDPSIGLAYDEAADCDSRAPLLRFLENCLS